MKLNSILGSPLFKLKKTPEIEHEKRKPEKSKVHLTTDLLDRTLHKMPQENAVTKKDLVRWQKHAAAQLHFRLVEKYVNRSTEIRSHQNFAHRWCCSWSNAW